jgi:glycosyltransferase involved in cell wall biosynthesis
MRLVIAVEDRLFQVGSIFYSHNLSYESFWKRYLSVFDTVTVIARVIEGDSVPDGWGVVNKNNVEIAALPQYHGPYQYVLKMRNIKSIISRALRQDDAVILRVPGNIGTQVWNLLEPGRPYGVEVIGNPWDVFAPSSIRSIIRPYARWLWTRNLKKQCKGAAAVAYVTRDTLQRCFPASPDAFTTYYSSIELGAAELRKDLSERLTAISAIPARLAGEYPPVRLGFVGSFSQTHKLPDVHIKVLAQCVAKGANVTLEMIGDGKMLTGMKKLAEQLGVAKRIVFRGILPAGKSIWEAMDKFDLFLNATASEGLPRVVIEAMSRGCPCIASSVGGTPELLEQSYLVPPGDVNSLAETILRVLADPESMDKAVERNLRIARDYCADKLQPRRQAFYAALRERTERYLAKKTLKF